MTDIAKEAKKTEQDAEAKLKTEKDHAEGKPSSETLNKAKVKTEDALDPNTFIIFFHSFLNRIIAPEFLKYTIFRGTSI
ncbi:MAG: hypothetical protein ACJ72V_06510 [Nitrososphaeraceae archaeon]